MTNECTCGWGPESPCRVHVGGKDAPDMAAEIATLRAELATARQSNEFLKRQLSQLATFNPDWDRLEAAEASLSEHAETIKAERERREQTERALAATREALWDIAGTIVAVCDSGNEEHAKIAVTETSPLVDAARDAIARFGLSNETAALASARSEPQSEEDSPDERPICEACSKPIDGVAVTTLDDVTLHESCARETFEKPLRIVREASARSEQP